MVGERWEWGLRANGHGASFWGDESILELKSGNGCMALNIIKSTELYT